MNEKQYKLVDDNGKFFVLGKGFIASTEAAGSTVNEGQVKCIAGLGFTGFKQVDAQKSYAVVYIRKGEGQNLLAGSTKGKADANKGQIDPSKRRFATEDEAWQHGSRARVRKANRGDAPGTAGHEGFFVVKTSDAVNSVINWKSGLTNPVK